MNENFLEYAQIWATGGNFMILDTEGLSSKHVAKDVPPPPWYKLNRYRKTNLGQIMPKEGPAKDLRPFV